MYRGPRAAPAAAPTADELARMRDEVVKAMDDGLVSRAKRATVGYLPQDPAFHPDRTVREILKFSGRLHPGNLNPLALRRRIDALWPELGLG